MTSAESSESSTRFSASSYVNPVYASIDTADFCFQYDFDFEMYMNVTEGKEEMKKEFAEKIRMYEQRRWEQQRGQAKRARKRRERTVKRAAKKLAKKQNTKRQSKSDEKTEHKKASRVRKEQRKEARKGFAFRSVFSFLFRTKPASGGALVPCYR